MDKLAKSYDSDVIEKWNLIKNESAKVHCVAEVDTVKLPDWLDRDRYNNVCIPLFAKMELRYVFTLNGIVWAAEVY